MQKFIPTTCLTLTCTLLGTSFIPVLAGETGHYVSGVEGIKAASLPPPGSYWRTYGTFYQADTLRDEKGDELDGGFDLEVFALTQRLLWVSDKKIWGGYYAADLIIPFVKTDLNIDTFGVADDDSGLADIAIEPFVLSWNHLNSDASIGIALYLPTGEYDKAKPASPGKDFWTLMLTAGSTYYLDKERTWAASVLARYEINSEKEDSQITPGNDFHFEWGLSRAINPLLEVGLAGYAHWQITDDSGADANWDKGIHDQVYAIGPEIVTLLPTENLIFSLRAQWEFGAEDRSEGQITTLTLTKIF